MCGWAMTDHSSCDRIVRGPIADAPRVLLEPCRDARLLAESLRRPQACPSFLCDLFYSLPAYPWRTWEAPVVPWTSEVPSCLHCSVTRTQPCAQRPWTQSTTARLLCLLRTHYTRKIVLADVRSLWVISSLPTSQASSRPTSSLFLPLARTLALCATTNPRYPIQARRKYTNTLRHRPPMRTRLSSHPM